MFHHNQTNCILPIGRQQNRFTAAFLCLLCTLISACSSEGSELVFEDNAFIPDHHRVFTDIESASFHLKVDVGNNGPEIQVEQGDLADTFDHKAAWTFTGETSIRFESLNRWLIANLLLAVAKDGSTLHPLLADNYEVTQEERWEFVPTPTGGCFIKNELMGSELTLGVDTTSEPFRVVMMNVDLDNETQRWRLDAFGDVDPSFEAVPDSNTSGASIM